MGVGLKKKCVEFNREDEFEECREGMFWFF